MIAPHSVSRLTLPAPAKVNLYLEILGRQADGFHALETVFQTLELADEISVEVEPAATTQIHLSCSDPTIPADERNLAWRAAQLFAQLSSSTARIAITLIKRIPHGAGLGGGSSDAASVLLALERLLPGRLDQRQVHACALQLGSDVPFFLLGGTAHALGRGEQLTPLPPLPRQPITICMPAARISTPAAYRALTDAERGPRTARGAAWAAVTPVRNLLHNRLTGPAVRLEPHVEQLLTWLAGQGAPHLLSGSGAACFALGHLTIPAPPPVADLRVFHTWTNGGALPH